MSFSRDTYIKLARADQYSDEEIKNGISYAENLANKGIPVIFDRDHLSLLIGVESGYLSHTILNRGRFYGYFRIRKKNGDGYREIKAPKDDLKYIQKWITVNILDKILPHSCCTGFRKGYSIRTNAEVHAEQKFILKIDLLKYFDTITEGKVCDLFLSMGYNAEVAKALAALCTINHRKAHWELYFKTDKKLSSLIPQHVNVTPQGAPSSPVIANLVGRKMDEEMKIIADTHGLNYSRYADDLVFSCDRSMLFLMQVLFGTIENNGFLVNISKSRQYIKGQKQYVTGLTISHGVHVSKKYRKNILTHLHYAKKIGVVKHLGNLQSKLKIRKNIYAYQDWLLGRIVFVYSIDEKVGRKMLNLYYSIDWAGVLLEHQRD